jgi:hypothetical protein
MASATLVFKNLKNSQQLGNSKQFLDLLRQMQEY